ncbi:MAG: acetyl-CoA C-acyltransferase [Propionibacteriales bacterium]|nr:acetyl-CoA C-acyltransferase [Propionibacteriales bacterium]
MREVVICEPLRTPVGRFGGVFRDVPAQDLGATVVRALLDRTGLDPAVVDEVVTGHCYPTSDAPALGRVVALDAGLPVTVTGTQVDRRCGSGLWAVLTGAMQVGTGGADVVIAGGAESMSRAPVYSHRARWGTHEGLVLHDALAAGRTSAGGRHHPVPGGMLETAENLRREYAVSREAQDAFAAESHRRAVAAQEAGVFAEEIVPVTVPGRRGDVVVAVDEHPRADTTAASLAGLRPVLGGADPEATVTAGNASGQNDGASACLVTTPELAARHGLRPLARLVSWGLAGVEPARMGIGPVPAVALALERAGLTLADLSLVELNEAFASQVLACLTEWGMSPDDDRLNPHGSGISLGHPVGATGGRILATMLRELERREGDYALETMCIGGGQGLAAVFGRWER